MFNDFRLFQELNVLCGYMIYPHKHTYFVYIHSHFHECCDVKIDRISALSAESLISDTALLCTFVGI
jgi:hypothetical protein